MAWKIIIIAIFPFFSIQWKNINHWIISLSEYHSQASDHTQRSCGCLEWSSVSPFDVQVTWALCDGKPPGWPPMIPVYWHGCHCAVPFLILSELVCVANRIWQQWWYVVSEASHKQACGFPFVSLWLLVLKKQLTRRPPWRPHQYCVTRSGGLLMTAMWAILKVDYPAPVSQMIAAQVNIDFNLMRNQPTKPPSKSWCSETAWDNKWLLF